MSHYVLNTVLADFECHTLPIITWLVLFMAGQQGKNMYETGLKLEAESLVVQQ